MAKRRTTCLKGPTDNSGQETHAMSLPMDVEYNSTSAANSTANPQPKTRPKPMKKTAVQAAPLVPDTVNDLDIPQQRPKRGRSESDADGTAPASIDQPPAKKKELDITLLVQRDGNIKNSCWNTLPPCSARPARNN